MSVIHRPLSNIRCVRSRRCGKQFTSPSAWLHHLESGACSSKMTRDKLRSTIQSSDINQLITGGSIQEYTALMRPDMSETTSITENVILTPNTDVGDSFYCACGGAIYVRLSPSPSHVTRLYGHTT